jgi:hypothetical protein
MLGTSVSNFNIPPVTVRPLAPILLLEDLI